MHSLWTSGPSHTLAIGCSRQCIILHARLEVGTNTEELHNKGDSCKPTQDSVSSEKSDAGDMMVEDGVINGSCNVAIDYQ